MLKITSHIQKTSKYRTYLNILVSKLSLIVKNDTAAYPNPAIFVTEKNDEIPNGSQCSKGSEKIKIISNNLLRENIVSLPILVYYLFNHPGLWIEVTSMKLKIFSPVAFTLIVRRGRKHCKHTQV